MKFLSGKLVKFALLAIVLLIVLIALIPTFLSTGFGRGMVEDRIAGALGTKAAIGEMDVGWGSGIAISDLAIDNPEGYSTEKFFTAKTIEVRPALVSTMRGRTNVAFVMKDAHVRIERDANGRLNTTVLSEHASKDEPAEKKESEPSDVPIDLAVTIERLNIDYVDHADPSQTKTIENVTLNLQIAGDRPSEYAGELKLAIDKIVGVPFFQPQRIDAVAKGSGGNWKLESANVPLAEGAVALSGTVAFVDRKFTANIDLSNVGIDTEVPGLDRILPIFHTAGGATAAGMLDAKVVLSGDSFELSDLVGKGSVSIRDGRITGNPIVNAILELTGGSKTLKFDALKTEFELLPGFGVKTSPVPIKSGDVDFEIGGTVGGDGTLDYALGIRPKGGDWDKIRKYLGSETIDVPVKGTVSSPELTMPDPAELLQRAMKGALEGALEDGVKKGLGDIFKDR